MLVISGNSEIHLHSWCQNRKNSWASELDDDRVDESIKKIKPLCTAITGLLFLECISGLLLLQNRKSSGSQFVRKLLFHCLLMFLFSLQDLLLFLQSLLLHLKLHMFQEYSMVGNVLFKRLTQWQIKIHRYENVP